MKERKILKARSHTIKKAIRKNSVFLIIIALLPLLYSCDSYNQFGIENSNYDSLIVYTEDINEFNIYNDNVNYYNEERTNSKTVILKKGDKFVFGKSVNSVKEFNIHFDTLIIMSKNDTIIKCLNQKSIFGIFNEIDKSKEGYYFRL